MRSFGCTDLPDWMGGTTFGDFTHQPEGWMWTSLLRVFVDICSFLMWFNLLSKKTKCWFHTLRSWGGTFFSFSNAWRSNFQSQPQGFLVWIQSEWISCLGGPNRAGFGFFPWPRSWFCVCPACTHARTSAAAPDPMWTVRVWGSRRYRRGSRAELSACKCAPNDCVLAFAQITLSYLLDHVVQLKDRLLSRFESAYDWK